MWCIATGVAPDSGSLSINARWAVGRVLAHPIRGYRCMIDQGGRGDASVLFWSGVAALSFCKGVARSLAVIELVVPVAC